jgi:conjugative transfer region protein TrbK
MKARIVAAAALVVTLTGQLPVSAQSVDDLLKDHALLRSELDRCKQMGMASNDDARCKTARAAEQKRFFGAGQDKYTPTAPQVYPTVPIPDLKAPSQPAGSSPTGSSPNG